MRYFRILLALIGIQLAFSACVIVPHYSHYNVRIDPQEPVKKPSGAYLASEDVQWRVDWQCRDNWQFNKKAKAANPLGACPKTDDNFIGVAISGGGSRASVFSTAVLFELQRYGLLQQVDVISSVSGGSFTAAYYVLSADDPHKSPPTIEGSTRPRWDPQVVFTKLQKNLIAQWVWKSLWLPNILRYWFTYYDRTDVMAWVIADTLYDTSWFKGRGFHFKDLNPQRPYLILNASNNTELASGSKVFCFTKECFGKLRSSIDRYPLAHAVMASAAFPAVFQSVTLKDYSKKEDWYVHLIDGGASDNLGITVLGEILKEKTDAHAKKLIIVIDAHKANYGKDPRDPDPRKLLDYYIDSNVIDAYQTLMDELRYGKTTELEQWLTENNGKLIHLQFDDLEKGYPELYEAVTRIKTNLKIKKKEAACLRHAARILVQAKMEELRADEHWATLIKFPPTEGSELPLCKLKPKKQKDESPAPVSGSTNAP
ncbi:MAG: patatin-like phospholipase family protein [Desulfobacterales bacterium]|nr:patatin-like phospholipase family protein [Desulfobacterales bacterium]